MRIRMTIVICAFFYLPYRFGLFAFLDLIGCIQSRQWLQFDFLSIKRCPACDVLYRFGVQSAWSPLVSRHKALAQAIIDFIADLDLDTKSGAISSPFASEALFGKGRQNFVLQQCSNCGVVASAPLRVDRTKKPREELDVYLKKCSRCFQVCPVNVFCSLGLSRFSLFFCCVCISLVSLCLSGPDTPWITTIFCLASIQMSHYMTRAFRSVFM